MADEYSLAPSNVLAASFPRDYSFADVAKARVKSTRSRSSHRQDAKKDGDQGRPPSPCSPPQDDEPLPTEHKEPRPWSEIDFSGQYHLYRIKSKYPIPGSALGKDRELRAQGEEQRESLSRALQLIQSKHADALKIRNRKQDLDTRVCFDIGVDDIIRRADLAIKAKEKRKNEIGASINVRQQPPQVRNSFEDFMFYVRRNNYKKVEHILREGDFMYINLKDGPFGNTPIIYACNKGHAQMARILLQGGADPNLSNDLGHYPLHRIWASWKGDCLATQRRDRAVTLSLLRDLLAFGADPNVIQQNGWSALHEAARKGPIQAVHMLLLFKADEPQRDVHGRIPMDIAAQCKDKGARERRELLRAWDVIRTELANFEYKSGWWKFCHDRHARLGQSQPIVEFLAALNAKEKQEQKQAVEDAVKLGLTTESFGEDDDGGKPVVDRYGHKAYAIVDEVVTGPIDIPDMRDQAPKVVRKGKAGNGASVKKGGGPPRYPKHEPLTIGLDKYLLNQEEPSFISKVKDHRRQDDGEEKQVTKYELRYLIASQLKDKQQQGDCHIRQRRQGVASSMVACANLEPKKVARDAMDSVIHAAVVREEVKGDGEGASKWVIVRPQRRGLDVHGRPKTGAYLGLRLIPRACPNEQQQLEDILIKQGGGLAADIRQKRRAEEEKARWQHKTFKDEKDIVYKDKLLFNEEALLPAGGVTQLMPLPGSDEPSIRGVYLQEIERRRNPRPIQRYPHYMEPWRYVNLFHKVQWD